jgi:general secretion pathway protein C
MQSTIWIRLATFVMWLLAAASVVYWGLKFVVGPSAPAASAVAAPAPGTGQVDAQALARGLGGGIIAPNLGANNPINTGASAINSSRFQLTGVVVSRSGNSRSSVALIGVDGKAPRPFRVGANLVDGVVLHSVAAGKAMLAANNQVAPEVTLELPKLSSAVVGTAVALRPALPNVAPLPVGAPAGVVAASTFGSIPVGAAGAIPSPPNPVAAGASPMIQATPTTPPSATGQRAMRPGAMRQREGVPAEGAQPAQ